jgi:hypothetical protein
MGVFVESRKHEAHAHAMKERGSDMCIASEYFIRFNRARECLNNSIIFHFPLIQFSPMKKLIIIGDMCIYAAKIDTIKRFEPSH